MQWDIDPAHREHWGWVFARLNERRNGIKRALGRPLLLLVSPENERVLGQVAPDLWSIRGIGMRLRSTARLVPSVGRVEARTRTAAGPAGADQAKPRSWHAYQAGTHRRLGCPTYVIVVTVDADVAVWAGGPFSSGQTVFRPIVIGPQQVPVVVDVDSARGNLNLALLSGLAHRHEPEVLEIGQALWHALDQPRREDRDHYWDVFLHAVGEATRRTMMSLFRNYVPQSEWGKKHYAEGRAKGEAHALGILLEARGLVPRPEHRNRIEACADPEQLLLWLRRAATATDIEQVFTD